MLFACLSFVSKLYRDAKAFSNLLQHPGAHVSSITVHLGYLDTAVTVLAATATQSAAKYYRTGQILNRLFCVDIGLSPL